jgi:two-component system, cell cycle response regulator
MTGGESRRDRRTDDYTALSDRMGHLLVLRLAMAVVVVAWSAIRPESLGTPFAALLGVSIGYVVMAAGAELLRRRASRLGFAVLSGLLLLDGLYLAYAMYITGATQSPIRFLIYLHLVAVSLLASYRTGLKVALWHSLLLFVVLYGQAAALLAPVDVIPGRGIDFDRMPVLNVTSFWLFALATSIFSAMNERELRQRRADLQALVRAPTSRRSSTSARASMRWRIRCSRHASCSTAWPPASASSAAWSSAPSRAASSSSPRAGSPSGRRLRRRTRSSVEPGSGASCFRSSA